MGISHWLVGMVGLFGGIVIASGLVALLIGLNILPRYAGITHTAHHMLLYENCAMAGAIVGNLFTLYEWKLPFGRLVFSLGGKQFSLGSLAAGTYGLFGGIFLGSWIIALTEILDIVPIMARRAGMVKGIAALIISTALGKVLWSLLFFYKGW
ncbi:MAG: stage V sporulation protein AB [Lachnospiraceae bacterium]|nr:stage V sporulation protein AB [Lachnospiraceae bacterium]